MRLQYVSAYPIFMFAGTFYKPDIYPEISTGLQPSF